LLLIGFVLLLSFSGCISRWLFLSFSVYYWVVLLVALVINFSYWFIISFILVINKKQEHFFDVAVCQNLVPLVNIKIAGKWMFIPLKMVLIGIDS